MQLRSILLEKGGFVLKKKWLLLFTFGLVLALLLAGCTSKESGGSSNEGDSKGGGGTAGGPVKISVFAPQDAEADLATNSFTKLVEEKFNIDFEWQTTTYDATSAAEVRNISLASGDYPDLYLLVPWVDQFSQTDLMKYGKQGVAIPLNDLIKEHAPNIQKVLDEHPYYASMATAPDGNIYGLPQLNECYHCTYPNKYWINNTWLEELGLEMPKTHEEFKSVLAAFKTQDPNGNGKEDEVPLSGQADIFHGSIMPFLMNGFIYDDAKTRLVLNNGKVDFVANKDEWKQGLEYIHGLYESGLIDPGAFTQNGDAYQALGDNADAQLLGVGAAMHPGMFVNTAGEYGPDYDAIPPLEGPNASFTTYDFPSYAGGTFVLTNKASEEAQIAAIKMVDYMFTEEGQLRAHFGEEDVSWRRPIEGDVANQEGAEPIFFTIPAEEGAEPRNDNWGAMAQYYQPREFRDGWVTSMEIYEPAGYERRLQQASNMYEPKAPSQSNVFPHWAVWVDPNVSDELSMMRTNIEDYLEQNSMQFITGDKDLDKDWDDYVKGFENLNLQRYLEIMQESYDNSNLN